MLASNVTNIVQLFVPDGQLQLHYFTGTDMLFKVNRQGTTPDIYLHTYIYTDYLHDLVEKLVEKLVG